jgi:Fis family transcriptional regulator
MDEVARISGLRNEANLKRELDGLITQMHSSGIPYSDAVRQFKKRYILEVLAQHKGNQCKAADELGMHRNTLSRTLAELEMDTAQIKNQIRDRVREGAIRNGMRRPPSSERPRAQGVAVNGNGTQPLGPRIANAR